MFLLKIIRILIINICKIRDFFYHIKHEAFRCVMYKEDPVLIKAWGLTEIKATKYLK